jgi:kynurenine formamidase
MSRWTRRPEGSNWGEFGPDDQLGRLNLLTPECRRAAAREIREGIAFTLSLPLDLPVRTPDEGRTPPRLFAAPLYGMTGYNLDMGALWKGCCDVMSDDGVTLFTQQSTQWDSLAHWGQRFDADDDGVAETVYYNGYRAGEHVLGPDQAGGPRATALGIEQMAMAGVQGRGVLVDLHAIYGDTRTPVGYEALMAAIEAQRVEVRLGDFLCLYTGVDELILGRRPFPEGQTVSLSGSGLDGRDPRLLRWLADSGIVALCSDNVAVEVVTPASPEARRHRYSAVPLHEFCLFKQGIYLGELWYLSELKSWLRAHGRSAFMLTAPPLRLPGSVGSPVTPIATV